MGKIKMKTNNSKKKITKKGTSGQRDEKKNVRSRSNLKQKREKKMAPKKVKFDDDTVGPDGEYEISEEKHQDLIKNIKAGFSGRTKRFGDELPSRTEAVTDIDEFNLNTSKALRDSQDRSKGTSTPFKVRLDQLISSADPKVGESAKKQISKIRKKKLLETPLAKTQLQAIQRKVGYGMSSQEIKKWDSVVRANRTAEQLHFPLSQADLRMKSAPEAVMQHGPLTEFEREISKLLGKDPNAISDRRALTPKEEAHLKAMSLEEAREKLKQLQRYRALQSYQESKFKRMKRIKSRQYHRILKKERLRKLEKSLDQLKGSNSEALKRQMQKLIKQRALERATLRHKTGGRNAKLNKIRSKTDPIAREKLDEQHELAHKLRQRVMIPDSSEESEGESEHGVVYSNQTEEMADKMEQDETENPSEFPIGAINQNPWLRQSSDITTSVSSSQATEASKGLSLSNTRHIKENEKRDLISKTKQAIAKNLNIVNSSREDELRVRNDSILIETTGQEIDLDTANRIDDESQDPVLLEEAETEEFEQKLNQDQTPEIDPKTFMSLKSPGGDQAFAGRRKKDLQSGVPDLSEAGEAMSDSEDDSEEGDDDQRNLISEAFAEDEVVEDFEKLKKEIVDAETEKDINTFLPGWGHWDGPDVKPSKRVQEQRQKFIQKADNFARKDSMIGHLIMSEKEDEKLCKKQVHRLPRKYPNRSDFEASIRHPVGHTWNPQNSFHSFVKPSVVTKMGRVIQPMDEDALSKVASKYREQSSLEPERVLKNKKRQIGRLGKKPFLPGKNKKPLKAEKNKVGKSQ